MNKRKNNFIKFSNIFFQMGAIIAGGTYFGHYLDGYLNNQSKLWTIILSLFSITIALYQVFKSIKKE